MTKSIVYGPNGTAVDGVTAVTFDVAPLNFDADFLSIDEGTGKNVMTDITSPLDQPSTLRIQRRAVANVYSGTSIDPGAYLATKRGTDLLVEVREVYTELDSEDSTYLKAFPFRLAVTATYPEASQVTTAMVERALARVVAAFAAMGDDDLTAGIDALLHNVVKKQ